MLWFTKICSQMVNFFSLFVNFKEWENKFSNNIYYLCDNLYYLSTLMLSHWPRVYTNREQKGDLYHKELII